MICITDKLHQPTMAELDAYMGTPLFSKLCAHMETVYKALVSVEYSGDKVLLGWNLRFRKSGRTLLRLYPRSGYFTVLVVIGRREREQVEALLPQLSGAIQEIYRATKEGMGQRWLLIDLRSADALYADVLTLVQVRRES